MHRQARAGVEVQANAAVLILFTCERSAKRRGTEDDAVVLNVDGEDFGECLDDRTGALSPAPSRSRSPVAR